MGLRDVPLQRAETKNTKSSVIEKEEFAILGPCYAKIITFAFSLLVITLAKVSIQRFSNTFSSIAYVLGEITGRKARNFHV